MVNCNVINYWHIYQKNTQKFGRVKPNKHTNGKNNKKKTERSLLNSSIQLKRTVKKTYQTLQKSWTCHVIQCLTPEVQSPRLLSPYYAASVTPALVWPYTKERGQKSFLPSSSLDKDPVWKRVETKFCFVDTSCWLTRTQMNLWCSILPHISLSKKAFHITHTHTHILDNCLILWNTFPSR